MYILYYTIIVSIMYIWFIINFMYLVFTTDVYCYLNLYWLIKK